MPHHMTLRYTIDGGHDLLIKEIPDVDKAEQLKLALDKRFAKHAAPPEEPVGEPAARIVEPIVTRRMNAQEE
ncbi:MAG: hypothetical protein ACE5I2_07405 [Anaerolineae bacterium]